MDMSREKEMRTGRENSICVEELMTAMSKFPMLHEFMSYALYIGFQVSLMDTVRPLPSSAAIVL